MGTWQSFGASLGHPPLAQMCAARVAASSRSALTLRLGFTRR
jgi:hypothetical protein